MKQFSDKDFLLNTKTAKSLFQSVAGLPIVEYHSRLSPEEIACNKTFRNITELTLCDSRKQSAMRSHNVEEYYISGEAGDYEKFQKWAEVVPCLIGSSLYHQTHLELQRFFGIYEPLSPATAEQIWNRANEVITSDQFCAFELFKKFNVQILCTPRDAADTLQWHQKISEDGLCPARVVPAFSATSALEIESPDFPRWVAALSEVCSREISDYFTLQSCLVERLLFFKSAGSKIAYQKISCVLPKNVSFEEADAIFQKANNGRSVTVEETERYQAHLLGFLIKKYRDYDFVMEAETANAQEAYSLIELLENLSGERSLVKAVISSENPSDYGSIAKKMVSSGISRNLRLGFDSNLLYQKAALQEILYQCAAYGVLPKFLGFSCASESFLAWPAQEYFRRILCNYLGNLVESGEYPNYPDLLKKFAKDICYENGKTICG